MLRQATAISLNPPLRTLLQLWNVIWLVVECNLSQHCYIWQFFLHLPCNPCKLQWNLITMTKNLEP